MNKENSTAFSQYLSPTETLDFDNPAVAAYAVRVLEDADTPKEKAVRLYYAVRDEIRYDPYYPFYKQVHYRASVTVASRRGFCISKAAFLAALCRYAGIPARIGFADVKNHLATENLLRHLGTDRFVYHGFTEMYLNGKWVKATPTFNKELCERHNADALEFDGENNAVFQSFNRDNELYMEYLAVHDSHADVSVDLVLKSWRAAYGEDRVSLWIDNLENIKLERDFDKETVVKSLSDIKNL